MGLEGNLYKRKPIENVNEKNYESYMSKIAELDKRIAELEKLEKLEKLEMSKEIKVENYINKRFGYAKLIMSEVKRRILENSDISIYKLETGNYDFSIICIINEVCRKKSDKVVKQAKNLFSEEKYIRKQEKREITSTANNQLQQNQVNSNQISQNLSVDERELLELERLRIQMLEVLKTLQLIMKQNKIELENIKSNSKDIFGEKKFNK